MNLVYILLHHFNIIVQFRSSSVLSVFRTQLIMHFSSLFHVPNNPPHSILPNHITAITFRTVTSYDRSPDAGVSPSSCHLFLLRSKRSPVLSIFSPTVSLQYKITGANKALNFRNRSREVKGQMIFNCKNMHPHNFIFVCTVANLLSVQDA